MVLMPVVTRGHTTRDKNTQARVWGGYDLRTGLSVGYPTVGPGVSSPCAPHNEGRGSTEAS